MARKLRLEYPGAIYHVINRGNYRADIFREERTKEAFETCVFAACAQSGWVLHAYVIMRNHYHLAVETPQGNLVAGMQWLQATFANRFNKLRGERGHLFQGRYKALLVEAGEPLGLVCHYIHLNPVRAGVLPLSRLQEYRSSSYWYLSRPKARPPCLQVTTALAEAGGLADTSGGRRSYADYLSWQVTEGPAGKSQAYASLSRGWALGSADFKTALIKDHALVAESRAWESTGAQEIKRQAWEALFSRGLKALGRKEGELTEGIKSAAWKVALAVFLKERTQASNPWLARRLGMVRPGYVSRLVSASRREPQPSADLAKLRVICTA